MIEQRLARRRLVFPYIPGLLTGLPAIACAKSRLIGVYGEPARHKGSIAPPR
ncbi:MAG: endonuclease V [Proteobacteria bacterium]|nr:endonuclease V [Pseudomonadota bacterium]MBU4294687.1 endonuclease V [Pseudomonadota bacterium]MCG2748599.1 endonuclease V [Desulfobulbaceae bacterium]